VGRKLKKATDSSTSLAECAEAMQLKGTSMISKFLRLLKLSPEVQHLVDWGHSGATISFTAAWRLTELLNLKDQTRACDAILEHQLTSREVEQLIQLRMRSRKPIAECIRGVLRMRPHVERRHVFIGAIVSEKVRDKLSAMVQEERDKLLGQVLRKLYSDLSGFACRLGVERFTIVGGDDVAAILTRGNKDFEGTINAALLGISTKV
jgi:hypothetical protein